MIGEAIEVVDFRGFEWKLYPYKYCRHLPGQMVEMWMMCTDVPKSLTGYPTIPVPVFTEWWP